MLSFLKLQSKIMSSISNLEDVWLFRCSLGGGGGVVAKSCLTLATSWTVDRQAPLPMGFSRQEYRGSSRPRNRTQASCIADRFFTDWAIRKARCSLTLGKWIYNYFHKSAKVKYDYKKKLFEKNITWNTDEYNINWSSQNIRLLDIMYIGLINIWS